MNRLVFSLLAVVGVALLIVTIYCAVMIDETEARLFMIAGAGIGLFVAGFSVYALFEDEPPIEAPKTDLNAQPLDPDRTDLRLMRWPGWAWLFTVLALAIVAIGYVVLGLGVDVPENRVERRELAVPIAVGFVVLWWVGRKALEACGVRFFKTLPGAGESTGDGD
jgi:hypothetical protein